MNRSGARLEDLRPIHLKFKLNEHVHTYSSKYIKEKLNFNSRKYYFTVTFVIIIF